MPNDKDLNIGDLDSNAEVKGGVGRPTIDNPGIGRDLPGGKKSVPGHQPGKLQPGVGGPSLPSGGKRS